MKFLRTLFTIALCVLCGPAISDSPTNGSNNIIEISGMIYDAKTNEPLPFCNITMIDIDNDNKMIPNQGCTSGFNGDFNCQFKNIPQGAKVRFSFIGYKEQILPPAKNMEIKMEPSAATLNDVTVTADLCADDILKKLNAKQGESRRTPGKAFCKPTLCIDGYRLENPNTDDAKCVKCEDCIAQSTSHAQCTLKNTPNKCEYETSCNLGYGNIQNSGRYNAQCTALTYKIEYILNGGKNHPENPSTYTYGVGTEINGTPTRNNYIFDKWCTDKELTQCQKTYTISNTDTGDKKFYASWTQKVTTCTLQFNDNSTVENINFAETAYKISSAEYNNIIKGKDQKPEIATRYVNNQGISVKQNYNSQVNDGSYQEGDTINHLFKLQQITVKTTGEPDKTIQVSSLSLNPTLDNADYIRFDCGTHPRLQTSRKDRFINNNSCTDNNCFDPTTFMLLDEILEKCFTDSSVWKNENGKFNTARLASDSIAGVVLGTVGGVVTSNIIKKNQIENGFEDLKCTITGQDVANYGDTFKVGVHY